MASDYRGVGRRARLSLHIPQAQVLEDLFTCIGIKQEMKKAFSPLNHIFELNNSRGMLEYTGIHDYYLKRKVLKNSTLPNGMLQLSKIAHHGYYCSIRPMN